MNIISKERLVPKKNYNYISVFQKLLKPYQKVSWINIVVTMTFGWDRRMDNVEN